MQLFICHHFTIQNQTILIEEASDLIHQFKKVLRAKPGFEFFIQDEEGKERWKVSLIRYSDNEVITQILGKDQTPKEHKKIGIALAFPNKLEKLELIVQKLTEIGISHLYLWEAERSQLNEVKENKMQRLQKIMKEAVEQSRGWKIPQIFLIKDLKDLRNDWNFMVFDLPKDSNNDDPAQTEQTEPITYTEHTKKRRKKEETPDLSVKDSLPFLGVIGPEGGLSSKDYEQFPDFFQVQSLGDTVLRMETAAIIGSWILKNR